MIPDPFDYTSLVLLMVLGFLGGCITTFLMITKGKVFDDKGRLIPQAEYEQQKNGDVK